MHRSICPLFAALIFLTLGACQRGGSSSPAPLPSGGGSDALAIEIVASNLAMPVEMAVPPGETARIFVVEKGGTIVIVDQGALLPVPFLDVSSLLSSGNEQGLLGLAFDPDYASSGRFYIYYTDVNGDAVIARYLVSGDPDVAQSAADRLLVVIPQPAQNHNGGRMVFGLDGYLYVGVGDGGGAGDPDGTGQDPSDLLGSILRLDVSPAGDYAIPPDNPFAGDPINAPEVWSYGLRNPWRLGFDPATGDLYVADVGQSEREEVSVVRAIDGAGRAANFGWKLTEGLACYEPASGCDTTGLVLPVLDYDHTQGCSITGGLVYRGSALPAEYQGLYFYADFCDGWVRSFRMRDGVAIDGTEWTRLNTGERITSFGVDGAGELYLMTTAGSLCRIVENVATE